jgi:hypothetical protein
MVALLAALYDYLLRADDWIIVHETLNTLVPLLNVLALNST